MIKPIQTDKYGNPNHGSYVRAINMLIERQNSIITCIDALCGLVDEKEQGAQYEALLPLVRSLVEKDIDPNVGGPVPGDLK